MQHLNLLANFYLGSGIRKGKVDSTIYWIVIFYLLQKGVESNDNGDIEFARDKMVNFNISFTIY